MTITKQKKGMKNLLLKSGLRYLIELIVKPLNPPKIVDNSCFWYFFCNILLIVFRGHVAGHFLQEYETILLKQFFSKLKYSFYTLGFRMSRKMHKLCVKNITLTSKSLLNLQ